MFVGYNTGFSEVTATLSLTKDFHTRATSINFIQISQAVIVCVTTVQATGRKPLRIDLNVISVGSSDNI